MLNFGKAIHGYDQIPLVAIIDKDDEILLNSPDAQWYKILAGLPWKNYQSIAADYYDALYDFNQNSGTDDFQPTEAYAEIKKDAIERITMSRPTVDKTQPVIFQPDYKIAAKKTVKPEKLAPGFTPKRFKGKKPKCFFALFKSFIGVSLMGFPSEPEMVHLLLTSNLPFARVCGFVPKEGNDEYWQKHVPALRKIQQFDQIMTEYGIWEKIKRCELRTNIQDGVIKEENVIVGDTSHYHALSGFEIVKFENEEGKEKTKTQSKVTKKCGCKDKSNCAHPWQLADEGAGTIVKSRHKKIWGHKASIIGLAGQEIPIDAAAVADAATHDGETFYPHVKLLFEKMPEFESWIDTALYDSAGDKTILRETFYNEMGIVLKTSMNPRGRQPITDNLPKGMEKITPQGEIICKGGFEMDYTGARFEAEKFIYNAPKDDNGNSLCPQCDYKPVCCPLAKNGRSVTINFDMLPHIDPGDPPMAKRFKAIMTRRPSVERMIKRLKCDLGDDRLKKRGNASFQAYLDKTLIAYHILLRC